MTKYWTSAQPDLFEERPEVRELGATERAKALEQKARRGELFLTVAVGYVKAGGDRIEKDADRRVQEAITLVFRKFSELQTVRQVLVWCRQEKILLPALGEDATADRIIWR